MMRTGVKDKEDIIPCLLLKFEIAQAFARRIGNFHLNEAVHVFPIVLGVPHVGNLRSIFKEGVIVAHFIV
jgi:hypothetical protein